MYHKIKELCKKTEIHLISLGEVEDKYQIMTNFKSDF